jgi:outer membrane protein
MPRYYRLALSSCVCLAAFALQPAGVVAQDTLPSVTIGVITDGPTPRFAGLVDSVKAEIRLLLERDAHVEFAADVAAGASVAGAESAIDQLLQDPAVDLVLILGPVVSHLAARRTDLPKPVVASFIYNAAFQGLPLSETASTGIPNLNYVAVEARPRSMLAMLEIADFTRVAVMAPAEMVEAFGDLEQRLRTESSIAGIDIDVIPVGTSAEEALAQVGNGVQAVFLLPLSRMSWTEFGVLVDGFIERRLASFSWVGATEVRAGILAGWLPENFTQRLARRTAINVQRIVLGEEPGSLPVFTIIEERITLNVGTAQAIGVFPPWQVYVEADLVGLDTTTAGRELNLAGTVREAIETNLDLAAEGRFVAAGSKEVQRATAPLLPQLGVGLDGRMIDQDRAEASFGIFPERSLTGGASFSQAVYDERLWANRSIEKLLQESRVQDLETLTLDIALDASVAYLNVLRGKTFQRIQKENLSLTRSNLELAQIRFSVGVADASEVFRWQSQIANDRQALVEAVAMTQTAEIELRRILNRPLDEPFSTVETSLNDPSLVTAQHALGPYIENPLNFMRFQSFMASEALAVSPELQSLRAIEAASDRALKSANRSFFIPNLYLDAGLSHFFAKGGATGTPPPGMTGDVNDTRWQVGLVLSYPVFTGLARSAERGIARERMNQIQLEVEAASDRIDLRVRTAMLQMGASRTNIDLSRDAAEAAAGNYDLVREAYARGVGNIITLLDAQNESVVSQEKAATAEFDFLIDLMRVERAVGQFYFFSSPQDSQDFIQRLANYFQGQN